MSIATSPGLIVDAISGAVLLALGAWVATRRPRTKVNAAFGGFAVAMGVGFVLVNVLTADDPLAGAADLAGGIALVLAGALLLYLGVHFPRPLTKDDRHMLLLPAGIGGVVGLVVSSSTLAGSQSVAFQIQSISIAFLFAAHVFVLALLPCVTPRRGGPHPAKVGTASSSSSWPGRLRFGPRSTSDPRPTSPASRPRWQRSS